MHLTRQRPKWPTMTMIWCGTSWLHVCGATNYVFFLFIQNARYLRHATNSQQFVFYPHTTKLLLCCNKRISSNNACVGILKRAWMEPIEMEADISYVCIDHPLAHCFPTPKCESKLGQFKGPKSETSKRLQSGKKNQKKKYLREAHS